MMRSAHAPVATTTAAGSWHDLLDVRTIDRTGDPQTGLKDPTFENIEIGERFGPVNLQLTDYRARRFGFIMGGRDAVADATMPGERALAHPGSYTNELFEIYTLTYAPSKIVGIHTSEEIWLDQPAHVGDVLVLSGSFVDKFEKRGQGYALVEAEARATDGALVARRRGTEIMRTVPGEVIGRVPGGSGGSGNRIVTELAETSRWIGEGEPDIRIGDQFSFAPQLITFEQAALYSRFGEYVVSIHGDLAFARAAGLAVPIVQGQQQMCLLLNGMLALVGPKFHRGGHIAAKFVGAVRVFSELTMQGRVVPVEGAETLRIECWLRDETGRTVTVATADWTV